MNPEQFNEVLTHLHLLPPAYQKAAQAPPALQLLPHSFFHNTRERRGYTAHDQDVGRYLYRTDPEFLAAALDHDLRARSRKKGISAHNLRTYCFQKFGIQNREVPLLINQKNMVTFLQTHHKCPQQQNQEVVPDSEIPHPAKTEQQTEGQRYLPAPEPYSTVRVEERAQSQDDPTEGTSSTPPLKHAKKQTEQAIDEKSIHRRSPNGRGPSAPAKKAEGVPKRTQEQMAAGPSIKKVQVTESSEMRL